MKILYEDKALCVCVKPVGVQSTDVPGGVPSLARKALKGGGVWTVHRLDQVVGGVMVLARNPKTAKMLSEQIEKHEFQKIYLAICHDELTETEGEWVDFLWRDRQQRRSYVVAEGEKEGSQEAVLSYRVLEGKEGMTLAQVSLKTGRTHQIRAQFSGHGHPLVGDWKYGSPLEGSTPALWSASIGFTHPVTGEKMTFTQLPPRQGAWETFGKIKLK